MTMFPSRQLDIRQIGPRFRIPNNMAQHLCNRSTWIRRLSRSKQLAETELRYPNRHWNHRCIMTNLPILLYQADLGPERTDDCACPDGSPRLIWSTETEKLNNDCACQMAWLKFQFTLQMPHFLHNQQAWSAFPLIDDFHLAYSAFSPKGPVVLNQLGMDQWYRFKDSHQLQDSTDRDLLNQGLISPIGVKPDLSRRLCYPNRLAARDQCVQSRLPLLLCSQVFGPHQRGDRHWCR